MNSPMKTCVRCMFSLLLSVIARPAIADEPIQLLRTGVWHGDEVAAEAGPDWWGIFPEGDGFTLQSAPVTMTLVPDEVIGEVNEATAKEVRVPQEAEPVLLVRGLKDPAQGQINALDTPLPSGMIYPGQNLYLPLRNVEQPNVLRVTAYGVVDEFPEIYEPRITKYQVKLYKNLTHGIQVQTLASIPEIGIDAQPRLVWAGDLDRDGKIDLLFNLTNHYNVMHLALFLSSAAKEGEFVGLVAEWRTTGC